MPAITRECNGGPKSHSINSDSVPLTILWSSQPTLERETQSESFLNSKRNKTKIISYRNGKHGKNVRTVAGEIEIKGSCNF